MQVLRKGSRGEEVKELQRHLNLNPDGIFGSITEEAVKVFQKSVGISVDGVVGQKTWDAIINKHFPDGYVAGGLPAGGVVLKKTTRPISRIIVHCSATAEGKDFTVADITRWHKSQGYATIGYHYVVYRDGSIHVGRDVHQIGAHCQGYNTGSIGVCYIGGCGLDGKTAKDTRTDAQKQALRTLLSQLRKMYPKAQVYGHRDFTKAKACPSYDARREYSNL